MSTRIDEMELLVLTMKNNNGNGPITMGNENEVNPDTMKSLGGFLKPSKFNPQIKLWETPAHITQVMELAENIGFTYRSSGSSDDGQTLFVVMDKF